MPNTPKKPTLADLEAAKERIKSTAKFGMAGTADLDIAATCIGIVEEMVKCAKPRRDCKWVPENNDGEGRIVDAENWFIAKLMEIGVSRHIAELHNLWLKAVAAFGGEVK